MLDLFTIFSKGGIVLWYFQGTSQLFTEPVNELIKSVILQERGLSTTWNHSTLSLQYKLDNEFELVFVVAYQNILKLTYVDKFLSECQLRFRDKYKQRIQGKQFGGGDFGDFKDDFEEILRECEEEARQASQTSKNPRKYQESEKSNKTMASIMENKKTFLGSLVGAAEPTPINPASKSKPNKHQKAVVKEEEEDEGNESTDSNNAAPLSDNDANNEQSSNDIEKKMSELMSSGGARKMGSRPRKFEKAKSGKAPTSPQQPKKGKEMRKWSDEVDYKTLDYGNGDQNGDGHEKKIAELAAASQYASKKDIGQYKGDLKPIEVGEEEEEEIVDDFEVNNNNDKKKQQQQKSNSSTQAAAANKTTSAAKSSSSGGGLFASFRNLVGNKVITKESIEPVMEKMQEHLVSKNVAVEIAKKICDNVATNLEGKQLGSFQFMTTVVKQAIQDSMVQILTPKKRVDILRDVYESSHRQKKPYVIVFCGVNGVGKSTNLAKISFWLIENSFRVLIAACDTFRSGAVEQLRTHQRHLNALHPPEQHDGNVMVDLYQQGYGKDAASIAHDAINYAKENRFDVVLVDTAGRMQDNEPLMKALAKLININNPDLVLFVGEALVGNEAVDQVRKFNQALIDNSPVKTSGVEKARAIDGIVLTKFDTIDDKVGAAISMTYITGQPIVFVGTGQTYSDLKSLNPESVVKSLLK